MSKRSKFIGVNICMLFLTVVALHNFISDITRIISSLISTEGLHSVQYSFISVTVKGLESNYSVGNYPLIPLVVGLIYNISFMIRDLIKKANH